MKHQTPRAARRFVEELSWLLDTYSNIDFKSLAASIDFFSETERSFSRHVPKNPNIRFLVGALPTIFTDEKYFPANEDLAEFASEALNLSIPRWEKRSRFELVGIIVCETVKLNDEKLTRLVDALLHITSEEANAQAVFQSRKKNKLSWNEIIQKLSVGR